MTGAQSEWLGVAVSILSIRTLVVLMFLILIRPPYTLPRQI